VKNSNKKSYEMQQFEDYVTETSICSQFGWHYICFVT